MAAVCLQDGYWGWENKGDEPCDCMELFLLALILGFFAFVRAEVFFADSNAIRCNF